MAVSNGNKLMYKRESNSNHNDPALYCLLLYVFTFRTHSSTCGTAFLHPFLPCRRSVRRHYVT